MVGALGAAMVSCGGDSTSPVQTAPASVVAASSLTASGTIGSVVAGLQPSIKVTDAAGKGVSGVSVTVQIAGGGSVQKPNPVTNGSGVASAGAWTLGPALGQQTVTLSVSGFAPVVFSVSATGSFTVEVRYVGGTPSAAVQAAFTAAANRVMTVVTTKLTAVNASSLDLSQCEAGLPVMNETVQNLVIFAEIVPIDGVGQILGQSGPCALRGSSQLPFVGLMRFDVADMNALVANGSIQSVVFHEMQHVLGFGSLWCCDDLTPIPVLLQAPNTSNPIYTGPAARAEYVAAGGTSPSGVPVEGGTVSGTSNSHWRETVFQSEMMTGFLSGITQPFSRISIAALKDLGYTVSFDAADSYTVPPPGALRLGVAPDTAPTVREEILRPWFRVAETTGKVTRIR